LYGSNARLIYRSVLRSRTIPDKPKISVGADKSNLVIVRDGTPQHFRRDPLCRFKEMRSLAAIPVATQSRKVSFANRRALTAL
jgi:hypothetical protein